MGYEGKPRWPRAISDPSDGVRIAVSVGLVLFVLIAGGSAMAWLYIAGAVCSAIFPIIKRRAGLPDWTPDEAYITKLRRRRTTPKQTDNTTRRASG
jgi:hypothetical protein